MTLRWNAVTATCLILCTCASINPQDKPKAKEATVIAKTMPSSPATCQPYSLQRPKEIPKVNVDLCPSSALATSEQREMELKDTWNNSIWVKEHPDDVVVWRATPANRGKQVAWTCGSQSFQLVSIVRIQTNSGKQPIVPPPADSFPFSDDLKPCRGDQVDKNKQLAAGTTLYSGPPLPTAEKGCYKYTFIVGKIRRDPHIIVTDPPGAVYNPNSRTTGPAKPELPKCDFEHRGGLPNK